ncbi:MAG TPA: hypothetical protein VFJ05_03890 [Nitrososphaeraceae archaeon]|nr:hypothetical protein [Nitrososphaeraceae archaeon]
MVTVVALVQLLSKYQTAIDFDLLLLLLIATGEPGDPGEAYFDIFGV